ncbi:MAG TPA: hypothetical protein VFE33_30165 [Thermoanaerobaculia bacterium]|nr:hypothetical protein [Thermoanaerobaculia bacterium]
MRKTHTIVVYYDYTAGTITYSTKEVVVKKNAIARISVELVTLNVGANGPAWFTGISFSASWSPTMTLNMTQHQILIENPNITKEAHGIFGFTPLVHPTGMLIRRDPDPTIFNEPIIGAAQGHRHEKERRAA